MLIIPNSLSKVWAVLFDTQSSFCILRFHEIFRHALRWRVKLYSCGVYIFQIVCKVSFLKLEWLKEPVKTMIYLY